MRRNVRAVAAFLSGFLAVSTSCSEKSGPTAPEVRALQPTAGALLGLLTPVQRVTPLASDVTWSFTAGPLGATSSNPSVGLTVVVPAGALNQTQTITVTALAGSAVAYAFAPHLEFDKKVRLLHDASQLQEIGLQLPMWGAHFEGDAPEMVGGLVSSLEQVPALLSILTGQVRFDVSHFSGWILASGNGGSPSDSSGSGSGQ